MAAEDNPKDLSISDYTYDLPEGRIARFPLPERDSARLLVCKNTAVSDAIFSNITDWLPNQATLVFNDSKVIHARLVFFTEAGHRIECFCLEPEAGQTPSESFSSSGPVKWKCMVGNARKWKEVVLRRSISGKEGVFLLTARLLGEAGRDRLIEFTWDDSALTFSEVLEKAGELPIPPYLEREAEEIDLIRYNTVYAGPEGSVAAPTAGLHFTDSVLAKLQASGFGSLYLTLHVGAGTFRPVAAQTMAGHEMHAERVFFNYMELLRLYEAIMRGPIVAVGTTSARTLESLYWLGLDWMESGADAVTLVRQWWPYARANKPLPEPNLVLRFLLDKLKEKNADTLSFHTQLLIAPGYNWRVVDALITNFHQPNSTLLLLVAALIGESWRDVYAYAMKNEYRFLSYGDSSLLFRKK